MGKLQIYTKSKLVIILRLMRKSNLLCQKSKQILIIFDFLYYLYKVNFSLSKNNNLNFNIKYFSVLYSSLKHFRNDNRID